MLSAKVLSKLLNLFNNKIIKKSPHIAQFIREKHIRNSPSSSVNLLKRPPCIRTDSPYRIVAPNGDKNKQGEGKHCEKQFQRTRTSPPYPIHILKSKPVNNINIRTPYRNSEYISKDIVRIVGTMHNSQALHKLMRD